MTIDRVTQQTLQRATLRNLTGNLTRMSDLQQRLSSGKAIRKPSDDPAGMVEAMRIRSDRRANSQHGRNASDGVGWLTTVDSALNSSLGLLRRARDLTVMGASSGSLGATSREAIAAELETTAEAIREQANARYMGRTVFAGTSDAGVAFDADGRHTGAPGQVQRRVSANATVRVDGDGAAVFGYVSASPGSPGWPEPPRALGDPATHQADIAAYREAGTQLSVFALLQEAANAVRAGDARDVTGYLDLIDVRLGAMLGEVANVGVRYKQVLEARERTQDVDITLETQLAAVEDVDLAETAVDLEIQEMAYQAALNATARALQPSLLEFLR